MFRLFLLLQSDRRLFVYVFRLISKAIVMTSFLIFDFSQKQHNTNFTRAKSRAAASLIYSQYDKLDQTVTFILTFTLICLFKELIHGLLLAFLIRSALFGWLGGRPWFGRGLARWGLHQLLWWGELRWMANEYLVKVYFAYVVLVKCGFLEKNNNIIV